MSHWKLNTSNLGKLKEFQKLFAAHGVELTASQIDLDEIAADPLLVITHKASQMEEFTLIEDTSLDIEDSNVGINIRWLIEHLEAYVGRKATWRVLLAYREEDFVHIYEGEVQGTIVSPKGVEGFGFDPYFLPDHSKLTLAESKPDQFNARALAVKALIENKRLTTQPTLYNWEGPWQDHLE